MAHNDAVSEGQSAAGQGPTFPNFPPYNPLPIRNHPTRQPG